MIIDFLLHGVAPDETFRLLCVVVFGLSILRGRLDIDVAVGREVLLGQNNPLGLRSTEWRHYVHGSVVLKKISF